MTARGVTKAQTAEIASLRHGWLTAEQVDGLVEGWFGLCYFSQVSEEQADQLIHLLRSQVTEKKRVTALQAARKTDGRYGR